MYIGLYGPYRLHCQSINFPYMQHRMFKCSRNQPDNFFSPCFKLSNDLSALHTVSIKFADVINQFYFQILLLHQLVGNGFDFHQFEYTIMICTTLTCSVKRLHNQQTLHWFSHHYVRPMLNFQIKRLHSASDYAFLDFIYGDEF